MGVQNGCKALQNRWIDLEKVGWFFLEKKETTFHNDIKVNVLGQESSSWILLVILEMKIRSERL